MEKNFSNVLPYLAMGAVIVGNVLGNVFLKLGSSNPGKNPLFGLFGWQTPAGIAFFALAVLFYAWALKSLPLHIAQAMSALQYLGGIMAAVWLFGETVSPVKWLGMTCILLGLMFMSY